MHIAFQQQALGIIDGELTRMASMVMSLSIGLMGRTKPLSRSPVIRTVCWVNAVGMGASIAAKTMQ
ncbi:MAG: hypothetical protein IIB54_14565 [Planctomycetes bacterium]|nr:hypothetical protein [Planctomycetota bacterium]